MEGTSAIEARRLYPNEWQDNPEWKARRLCFIWLCMYEDVDIYRKLVPEKNDFYIANDKEVNRLTHDYYMDYVAIKTGTKKMG